MAVIEGSLSGNQAEVNSRKELNVTLTTTGSNAGVVGFLSIVDDGNIIGERKLLSPETDFDYRLRSTFDNILDFEIFNYASQNTGKHTYTSTTMTNTWSTTGLTTNGGSSLANAAGTVFGTYAYFPILGNSSLYCEIDAGFSAQPVTNFILDFGLFLRNGNSTPLDGVYFRLNASGLRGVVNYNGSESSIPLSFTYINSTIYRFTISFTLNSCQFWIDNVLYGEIITPEAQGISVLSAALPFSIRHLNTGVSSGVIQMNLKSYQVSTTGFQINDDLGTIGNRLFGSYQGLSGGTMGSLTSYTNSTNPTAAVPSNTALTANLPSGLGGQAWESFSTGLAANADGILMSYQVPTGTVSIMGKRLKVRGIKMSAFVQTALTGGGFNSTFALAFGHTAVSMAATETGNTKSRRIVLLPELTQTVASGLAALSLVPQNSTVSMFDAPIYVNPGEFIAFIVKHIGTVASAGTISYNIQYVYSWE